MIDEVDLVFSWESAEDYNLNQCRLHLYWLSWTKAVVIASNITVFPGRKIANATPQIVAWISDSFDLCSHNIMLVEHYQSKNLIERDVYLHVLFESNETMRYEIGEDKLTQLIYHYLI